LGQRAALYCRVSTAGQSCERQERDLAAFALRAGYLVVGTFKETASGVRLDRAERKRVLSLVQRREIDAVLVTELSRWGRSTTDLLATLKELEARRVSLVALNGMTFDLATPHGRMMATVLAGISAFERELTAERIRSGIAAAKARGKRLGRQPGERPKSHRLAPKVLALVAGSRSYRLVAREVVLSALVPARIAGSLRRRFFRRLATNSIPLRCGEGSGTCGDRLRLADWFGSGIEGSYATHRRRGRNGQPSLGI
jgi:putative DNA-invertase from lambdoid prophage Rac